MISHELGSYQDTADWRTRPAAPGRKRACPPAGGRCLRAPRLSPTGNRWSSRCCSPQPSSWTVLAASQKPGATDNKAELCSRPFPEAREVWGPAEASERGPGQLLHSLPSLAVPTRAEGAGGLTNGATERSEGPPTSAWPARMDGAAAHGLASVAGVPRSPLWPAVGLHMVRPASLPQDSGFPARARSAPGAGYGDARRPQQLRPAQGRGSPAPTCLYPNGEVWLLRVFWFWGGFFAFQNMKQHILRKREVVFTRDLYQTAQKGHI